MTIASNDSNQAGSRAESFFFGGRLAQIEKVGDFALKKELLDSKNTLQTLVQYPEFNERVCHLIVQLFHADIDLADPQNVWLPLILKNNPTFILSFHDIVCAPERMSALRISFPALSDSLRLVKPLIATNILKYTKNPNLPEGLRALSFAKDLIQGLPRAVNAESILNTPIEMSGDLEALGLKIYSQNKNLLQFVCGLDCNKSVSVELIEVINRLLAKGADRRVCTENGQTLLHLVANPYRSPIFECLLKKNFSAETFFAKDNLGNTILLNAASSEISGPSIIPRIIAAAEKFDNPDRLFDWLNARDSKGRNVLHIAVEFSVDEQKIACIVRAARRCAPSRALLDKFLNDPVVYKIAADDYSRVDDVLCSPLKYAMKRNTQILNKMVALGIGTPKEIYELLYRAVMKDDVRAANRFIEVIAEWPQCLPIALKVSAALAARHSSIGMLGMLVNYGADLLAKDAQGKTALDKAVDRQIANLYRLRGKSRNTIRADKDRQETDIILDWLVQQCPDAKQNMIFDPLTRKKEAPLDRLKHCEAALDALAKEQLLALQHQEGAGHVTSLPSSAAHVEIIDAVQADEPDEPDEIMLWEGWPGLLLRLALPTIWYGLGVALTYCISPWNEDLHVQAKAAYKAHVSDLWDRAMELKAIESMPVADTVFDLERTMPVDGGPKPAVQVLAAIGPGGDTKEKSLVICPQVSGKENNTLVVSPTHSDKCPEPAPRSPGASQAK